MSKFVFEFESVYENDWNVWFFSRAKELESKLEVANKTLDLTDARLVNTEKQLKDVKLDNSLLKTAPAAYLSKYYPYYSLSEKDYSFSF